MNKHETELIRKLSAGSSLPRDKFKNTLLQELKKREDKLSNKTEGSSMNFKILGIALTAIILLAGGTFVLLRSSKDQPEKVSQTATEDEAEQSTSQAVSLPSEQLGSLEEAKKSLSFTPLLPKMQIANEVLGSIKVGSAGFMIDDSDTIYLSYKNTSGTLYKVAQTTKENYYPEQVEEVDVIVKGSKISASYHRLDGEGDNGDGPNSSGEQFASPRSYLFFKLDEVYYEISEFGSVSKEQLTGLASSLE